MTTFTTLREKLITAADLAGAMSVLSWDQETQMPNGGAERRGGQQGTLAAIRHNLIVNEIAPMIDQLVNSGQLNSFEQVNVEQAKREIDKTVKFPESFVREITALCANAQPAWAQARHTNNFSLFQPFLEKIVVMKRQEADILGYQHNPYNALLDAYEPGATVVQLDQLFDSLRQPLQKLIQTYGNKPQPKDDFLMVPVAKDLQWDYCTQLLEQLGYDFEHGRQDESEHPFSISFGPEDVRITTKIHDNDIMNMLYSSFHECGHALYELGLPAQHYGLPACEACSLSIHESQSRLWENNICRSLPFWQNNFNGLTTVFADKLKGYSANDVFKAVNIVKPSLIRIQADELTYHFHIIIRYELEKAIINKELEVKDLPTAWNELYQKYLGIRPTSDSVGVLQDVHWSHGSFGYFPTYTLGSLYAAQFYAAIQKQTTDLEGQIAKGDYTFIHQWLKTNIWQKGRMLNSDEICRIATGESLNTAYFLTYMQNKLTTVYDI